MRANYKRPSICIEEDDEFRAKKSNFEAHDDILEAVYI